MSATRSSFLKNFSFAFLSLCVVSLWTAPLCADPFPNQTLKFQQLPLNAGAVVPAPNPPTNPLSTAPYDGHDVLSTAYWDPLLPLGGWRGDFAADDFGDKVNTPVVHVRWWGSYFPNTTQVPTVPNYQGISGAGVQKFLIAFESDNPSPPAAFSHPGTVLSTEIVNKGVLTPGSGTFTEKLLNGAVNEHIFEYNAELALPFSQVANQVYWLKIVALVDQAAEGNIAWGWHNRDYSIQDTYASTTAPSFPGENNGNNAALPVWHFQDDAVTGVVNIFNQPNGTLNVIQPFATFNPTNYQDGIDGPPGQVFISNFSQDLAFELYTPIPEPSTFVLGGLGIVGLVIARRRSRQ